MSPRFHHNAIPRRGIAFEILRFFSRSNPHFRLAETKGVFEALDG